MRGADLTCHLDGILQMRNLARRAERVGYMGFLGWIVFGLIVGAVAKLVMPGRDPGGIVVTMGLGILGAMLGGWIGQALGMYRQEEPVGFVMATVGAIIVLSLYRFAIRRRSLTP